MDFFTAMNVSSSALTAERTRMNLISGNMANANSTRTAEGGPYKRKDAIFTATAEEQKGAFAKVLFRAERGPDAVAVTNIVEDQSAPQLRFEPNHPDANAEGYVAYPNVNVVEEMTDMISATRAYEANVTAAQAAKSMAMKTLELAK